jgi:hypothetical protein
MERRLALIPVLLIFFFSASLWAGIGGTISGRVTDASGAVVPNAAVNAINEETGVRRQAETNGQGFYSFVNLPVGHYVVAIEKASFKPYQRTGIAVDADGALTVDAILAVGGRSDSGPRVRRLAK